MLAIFDPLVKNENPSVAAVLHNIYAPVCHQISDRSIQLNSHPMGFCTRCAGFYSSGLFVLLFFIFRNRIRILPLSIYILFLIPMITDFTIEKTGLYNNIALIRFLTGGMAGLSLFHLLVVSLSTRDDVFKLFSGEKVWITNQ